MAALVAVAADASAHDVRFEGGLWFDGDRFVPGTWHTEGGVLREGPGSVAADAVVDLSGLWIVPPLADAHTHALADSPDPAADAARFVRAGILFAKNPNSTFAGMERGRHALTGMRPAALRVSYAGSGLTSPGGHPSQIYSPLLAAGQAPEGWVPVANESELDVAWQRLRAAKPDFVKLYLEDSEHHAARRDDPAFVGKRGLDPALFAGIVDRAHAEGLKVSVHVRSAADFRVAVAAGVDEISHLPLEPITADDARACAERGATVVTTVLSHRPTTGVADPGAVHRANLGRLREASVRLALGTDNMHVDVVDELLAVAAFGVFDAPGLLRLATTESIRAATGDADAGALAAGAEATFLALRSDPLANPAAFRDIAHRFVRGEPIPEPAMPQEKSSLADALGMVVMHESTDAAIAKYHELRRDQADDFDFGEPQLNTLGYALLRHGRAADAVRIFALNAEQFPNSPNVWDSLGEAQLAAGDPAGARDSAQRVLDLLKHPGGYPESLRTQLEATARARLAAD